MTTTETLDRIAADVAYLAERQRRTDELLDELQPIAKLAMGVATERLAELEAKGWFRFGAAAAGIADRVVAHYGPEELDALAENVVRILDVAKALTQPEILAIAAEAAEVVQERDSAAPLGVTGLVRASRDEEVQRGLSVMIDLLRHLGRAADTVRVPDRSRRPSHGDRSAAPAPRPSRASRLDPDRPRRTGTERGLSCARPSAPGPAAATVGGVAYTAEGFLADPAQWTEALAADLAAAAGVELTDSHWALVRFARKDWQETGVSPNIRRLSTGAGVSTRDIYTLFRKAPGKTVARIAGIPKPAGCI